MSDQPALSEFTPRERGVIAGLADRWDGNPFPPGRNVPNREYDEWRIGFTDGQAIRAATVEKEYEGD